jgi:hypothetical protein
MRGIVQASTRTIEDLRVGRYPPIAQVDFNLGRFEELFRFIRFLKL